MQVLINGIIGALGIVPVALAFAVVYLPTRVFYIALAGIYAFVPYIAWALMRGGAPTLLALAGAIISGVIMSLIMEFGNHAPLERKGGQPVAHFIASMGAYVVIVQVIILAWGPEPQSLRPGSQATVEFIGIVLAAGQIAAVVAAGGAIGCFYSWLSLTGNGLQLRALASNPAELSLRGHNVRRLRLQAFGLSGALCSTASLVTAWDMGFDPHWGLSPVLLGIVASVLGGGRSFAGPVLGMLILGLVRVAVLIGISAQWQDAVTFLLLALGLYCRPSGVLGTSTRNGGAV